MIWAKLKASCFHSLTVAWGYLLALAGGVMSYIDMICDALGDPSLHNQISTAIGDPKLTARVLLFVGVVTIVARLRTAGKQP